MNRLVLSTLLVVVSGLAGPGLAEGQFIDWIHRLSGPRMAGPGVSYYWGERSVSDNFHLRVRMAGAYRWAINASEDIRAPEDRPDENHVHMVSIHPSIDLEYKNGFGVNAGAALHWFGGDISRAFWHWSFPVYLQFRHKIEHEGMDNLYLRLAGGSHYFLKFHEADFLPLDTGVKKEAGEFSFPDFQIGLEYKWY